MKVLHFIATKCQKCFTLIFFIVLFPRRSASSTEPDKSRFRSSSSRRSRPRTKIFSSKNFSKLPERPDEKRKSTNCWPNKIGSNKPLTFWTKIDSYLQSKPTRINHNFLFNRIYDLSMRNSVLYFFSKLSLLVDEHFFLLEIRLQYFWITDIVIQFWKSKIKLVNFLQYQQGRKHMYYINTTVVLKFV